MLTNPSTLGLFDENIEEIERIFHGAGALMYYDGANLNAVCGISRPGRHGLRHRAHQPAQDVLAAARRRRARAAGRSRCGRCSSRSCPCPRSSAATDGTFGLDYDRPKSIGKVRGFTGPFGVFVRSYAYIRMYGPRPARDVGDRRAERELPARAAEGRVRPAVRPAVHARVRALGAQPQARPRRDRARRRQAADGLRLPPADDLLPARRPRGADDRADRDRDEGDARRVLRRDARDRARGGRGRHRS